MSDLKLSSSNLDGIICYEKVNLQVLEKLINSTLLQSWKGEDNKYNSDLEQLREYKKKVKAGLVSIKYSKSKNSKFGRVYPEKGLGFHMMRRSIRHTLAKQFYTDIDIENAAPTMLYQICQMHEIKCPVLEKYCNGREKFLEFIMKSTNTSRGDAKCLIISLMFGGSWESWCHGRQICIMEPKVVHNLSAEITNITKKLIEINPTLLAEIGLKSENIFGRFLNNFLFEHECRVLECVHKYLCDTKRILNNNCALCADGILIETQFYSDEILAELNKIVHDTLNFDLKFTKKEMDEDYLDILDSSQNDPLRSIGYSGDIIVKGEFRIGILEQYFLEDIQTIGEADYISNYKNTRSFKYFNYYHIFEYTNEILYKKDNNNLAPYKKFSSASFPELIVGKKTFAGLYRQCLDKRKCSGFTFNPNIETSNDDKYNNFIGFIHDDKKEVLPNIELIQPMLTHILYICQGDEKLYTYLINWFAWIIQKPHIKTCVALVFYSETKGVGKNIIIETFKKLLTGYCGIISGTNRIGHNFNADMLGKLFIEMNEVGYEVSGKVNEIMDMVSRLDENIEFKGIDKKPVPYKDFKNYVATTNNDGVFPFTHLDRKFQMFECPHHKRTHEEYVELYGLIEKDEFLAELHRYLKNINLTEWHPTFLVNTEYTQSCIMKNLKPYLRFILENYDADYKGKMVSAKKLYSDYVEYLSVIRKGAINHISDSTFYKAFYQIYASLNVHDAKGVSHYKFYSEVLDIRTEDGFTKTDFTYEEIYDLVKTKTLFQTGK